MSMFIAMNGSDCILLCADGRVTATLTDSVSGNILKSYVSDDNFDKVSVIGKSLLGITGHQALGNKFRADILYRVNDSSTYNEIDSVIEAVLNENRSNYNGKKTLLILSGVSGGVPMYTTYEVDCPNKPHVKRINNKQDFIAVTDMAANDSDNNTLLKHIVNKIESGEDITNAIVETFKEGSRLNSAIGGTVRIYIAKEDGAQCIRTENINNVVFNHFSQFLGPLNGGQINANSINANSL